MDRFEMRALAAQLRALVAHYSTNGPEPVQNGPDEGAKWVGITPTEWAEALAKAEALAEAIDQVNNPVYAEARAEEAWALQTTLTWVPPGR